MSQYWGGVRGIPSSRTHDKHWGTVGEQWSRHLDVAGVDRQKSEALARGCELCVCSQS